MGSFCWSNLTFFRYPLGYFSEIPFDFCFYSGRSISSSELWEGNTLSLALFYSRLDFPNSTSEPMKLGFWLLFCLFALSNYLSFYWSQESYNFPTVPDCSFPLWGLLVILRIDMMICWLFFSACTYWRQIYLTSSNIFSILMNRWSSSMISLAKSIIYLICLSILLWYLS